MSELKPQTKALVWRDDRIAELERELATERAAHAEELRRVEQEREQWKPVRDEILGIIETYNEQYKSDRGVCTPGGLEHMGDVWSMFLRWEAALTPSEQAKGGAR